LAVGLYAPLTQALPWLQGTLFILFIAYITRFFAVGHYINLCFFSARTGICDAAFFTDYPDGLQSCRSEAG